MRTLRRCLHGYVDCSLCDDDKQLISCWKAKDFSGDIQLPQVFDEATDDFRLLDGPYDISKYRVLDEGVLAQVRADIATTILPSWLDHPPKNFGSVSHGKLKADQWRVVCTISLVITLVRLWGSADAESREGILLNNFIHLVTAVDLATRRSLNPDRVEKFDGHLLKYLEGLRSYFAHDFVPNHHLSLHLKECMLLFGPVHAWWGFPFERYNGMIQALNTNSKSSESNRRPFCPVR